jgi:hypothetical protein
MTASDASAMSAAFCGSTDQVAHLVDDEQVRDM